VIRIDLLPDDVLQEIFYFYVGMSSSHQDKTGVEKWQSLVHVCRGWRSVVLGSPLRLNLQLFCTPKTPVKDTLDVWPPLPLIVEGNMTLSSGMDNIIAALEHNDRVCRVSLLNLAGWQLEEVLSAMQMPFPKLTDLRLFSDGETLRIIPGSFLGGSAPRLQYFKLSGIPFPGLPKLLLSTDHLVGLELSNIPHSGYISPETTSANSSKICKAI
jgi:F-box-like